MREYLSCGAQLGWLIDPQERRVWVYQPGKSVERLEEPASISAEPFLHDFIIDLALIWNPPV
jgi:Uma2 family endonuclease